MAGRVPWVTSSQWKYSAVRSVCAGHGRKLVQPHQRPRPNFSRLAPTNLRHFWQSPSHHFDSAKRSRDVANEESPNRLTPYRPQAVVYVLSKTTHFPLVGVFRRSTFTTA